jgi:hypothetical protein
MDRQFSAAEMRVKVGHGPSSREGIARSLIDVESMRLCREQRLSVVETAR